jgi:phosphoribosylformylglycinamidine synthase
MSLIHFYRQPALSPAQKKELLSVVQQKISPSVKDIQTEYCFNIEIKELLTQEESDMLRWLLSETFEPENFSDKSFLNPKSNPPEADQNTKSIIEVGPRMSFTTAWSTNAVSVCHACGLKKISRIERSRRYRLVSTEQYAVSSQKEKKSQHLNFTTSQFQSFLDLIHDRMTECPYTGRLTTFETGIKPEPVYTVPLIEEGTEAIKRINVALGLGLDAWDINYYYNLFVREIGRNPTNVECFDLGQSNSEHSRHWFFNGRLIIDGEEKTDNLLDLMRDPLRTNPQNSIIAFKDNSSGISGYEISSIVPEQPDRASRFRDELLHYHIIFTAETHNFPTGVAPFPGAETGTGGRIRDVHATGRGSFVIAGTAAYCVGNLQIPGYHLPWEDLSFVYPVNLASPLQIEIEASNGASDYGNKFGEPVIQGFTRSFGMRLPDGERREWVKPIMFTGGQYDTGRKY